MYVGARGGQSGQAVQGGQRNCRQKRAPAYLGLEVCAACTTTNVDGAHANMHWLHPPRQTGGGWSSARGAEQAGWVQAVGGGWQTAGRWQAAGGCKWQAGMSAGGEHGSGRRAMSSGGVMNGNNAAGARHGCQAGTPALKMGRAWGTWLGEMHFTTTRWRPFHLLASTSGQK
jgi:hypothetical protein